ncbi:MAG: dihydrofolate reductase family protein, partial [Bacteroidetes bacterium]|nr:dihydrofolate reductase family protein [Candidatus Cryptobacteroides gallistercoris]
VRDGLADEFYFFIAPKIIGGRTAKGPVGGDGFPLMSDALQLSIDSVTNSGDDLLIHAYKTDIKI